ncbi:MAG: Do family serine endopeptidase [Gammaproteobacteria bacterium]|nr:Do family serine endopeptidase [Gammaproteobacteria bacterium]MCW8840488.1 Do family serine endopeptidase [Gammaproteobacteria bacterium]MCW8928376.1 Do family serine endopeptidase [Gammaproteobacteria bacterium]MCW8959711.1 Do family serine endopeptidase [Gammaproteobacteria bacterium]MCW8971908.1 Do family serine endopeptidase [Gammaproteobacteria bacterium]
MKLHKVIVFLFQSITVGLALAFLIVVGFPELLDNGRNVVAFIENKPPEARLATTGPVSYAEAVDIAAPAVVNIHSSKTVIQSSPLFDDPLFRRFFGDQFGLGPRERQEASLGSGVIVSQQGYILTNNHVIDGAEEIQIALHDGRTTDATVVGSDAEADLAVLKVELNNLPVITLGDSNGLRVGDVVLAIGNPFGVGQTVTQGIISATGRSELGINTFENFIQTDAAINPGNSGGALITARGELIGINTAIFSQSGGSEGIGFAIPVSLAKVSMAQIIEKGYVSRGWLGVEIQALSPELAVSFGLKGEKGVIIAGILRNGPADQAGLEPGDIILQLNGQNIENVHSALNAIAQTPPGDSIAVTGVRNKKPLQLEVVVAERPQQR